MSLEGKRLTNRFFIFRYTCEPVGYMHFLLILCAGRVSPTDRARDSVKANGMENVVSKSILCSRLLEFA